MYSFTRVRRSRRIAVAGLAVVALAASGTFVANAATPPPAHNGGKDGLKQVGPIDETNGYPLWFKDTNNVRLELCLDPSDSNCIMGDLPNPGQPVSFPDNFPDEAFWSVADSSIDAGGGDQALLVTATEAAFGSADGLPAKGAQISAPDIHAHNTFAQPNAVGITEATVAAVQNGVLTHRFPPASVTRLQFALA